MGHLTCIAFAIIGLNLQHACSSHQKQVHCIESAEFLCYYSVTGRAGVQQRGHQSGYVKARVPQWFL